MSWPQVWLILHILSVIVAFGPTFAFPLLGKLAQKHPQHGLFAVEATHTIAMKMTLPLALVAVPGFGAALIISKHYVLFESEWLLVAIALYVLFLLFAILVQIPNTTKVIDVLRSMPPGPPPEGAQPPPALMAALKKVQMGGAFLTLLILVFVTLMVWRPGSCQFSC